MRDRLVAAVFGLALACTGLSAWAQEKPLYIPARDVAVTYRLISTKPGEPPGPGREAHMYFSTELNRLRLDQPSQHGYVVIDRNAQQMFIVMTDQRSVMQMPFDPEMARGFILSDQMSFSRIGSDTVAGLACTKWRVTSARASGSVCVTVDGVLLSGQGKAKDGASNGIEATAVAYAPQPPSLFNAPPEYKQVKLPSLRMAP